MYCRRRDVGDNDWSVDASGGSLLQDGCVC